ncbi:hypothetical protein EVAR_67317_1 [Eumeta japonica]|uniref:Uncharacterized protein n=1 Tax=Eumeta variegata TaxID=151549 RepID=A0A4C1ZCU3_EUMVA|nr:hypothetical protein EVAR_67317_1 [Eumeta japonica]
MCATWDFKENIHATSSCRLHRDAFSQSATQKPLARPVMKMKAARGCARALPSRAGAAANSTPTHWS